jgi:hypothetical protein
MRREWLGILLISASVGVQQCVAAAPAEDLDEVLVPGTRLSEMKAAIAESEDRFYARYNELNEVDDFDIECRVDAPLGTRIPQRLCLTKLQLRARAAFGREYLQSLQELAMVIGGGQGPGKPPDTNPVATWSSRYEDYRNNMLDLMKMNPDLQRLATQGEAARKRFEHEHKRRFKGRL